MAELMLRPLLARAPELVPPRRWRVILLPALLAILGMLIALAAVTAGQDARRAREYQQIAYDRTYWENELAQAKLAGKPEKVIEDLEKTAAKYRDAGLISYAKYGRQFTSWDGYRYEEIVDNLGRDVPPSYVYHLPSDDEQTKESSLLERPGWPEKRSKNVVWYPLYPILAFGAMKVLDISSTNALTAVSWTCCLLGSVVLFLYARRHYFNRMPTLDLESSEEALALEAHPARRWDLSPQDTAAFWVVVVLLVGPCSVFLYANFTESLFVLLLACFLYCVQSRWWWRAALVAGVASACRSQGVLFGPVLALTFLLRSEGPWPRRIGFAAIFGIISAIGLGCYMIYLQMKFQDPLAFMHAQKYWNVGVDWEHIRYAANPGNAMTQVVYRAFYQGAIDWPRLWESLCLIWPPVVLLLLGGRYLSFELEVLGWLFWGLPYVSNCMAGNPKFDTQWMSMGRFMAVMIPAYVIFGAVFVRFRWLGVMFLVPWAGAFAVFCYLYGNGAWVG